MTFEIPLNHPTGQARNNETSMTQQSQHIHACFDKMLGREEKEHQLRQHARVIWLTGLSGSGKSTIAFGLEKELVSLGFLTQILDGDNIRSGINSNLGFSEEDRRENIRRISEVSKLFLNCGIICINSFITPTQNMRALAKEIIGKENLVEVYVNAPLEVCEQRDTKGLYKKARAGLIKDFTGIDSPYEPPPQPDLVLHTDQMKTKECITACLKYLLPIISYT